MAKKRFLSEQSIVTIKLTNRHLIMLTNLCKNLCSVTVVNGTFYFVSRLKAEIRRWMNTGYCWCFVIPSGKFSTTVLCGIEPRMLRKKCILGSSLNFFTCAINISHSFSVCTTLCCYETCTTKMYVCTILSWNIDLIAFKRNITILISRHGASSI